MSIRFRPLLRPVVAAALLLDAALGPAPAAPNPGATPAPKAADAEKWRDQFQAGRTPLGQRMAAPTPSPDTGKVTYTLQRPKEPSEEEAKIFDGIEKSMQSAVAFYNRYTALKKHLTVTFNPGVPTADGNINGSIRVGGQRNTRVLLHEMGHCMGVGQHRNWGKLMTGGRWQGERANALLREWTGDPQAQLHGDRMHFWPYGLNFDNEAKSDEDMIRHARLVEAMAKDLDAAK